MIERQRRVGRHAGFQRVVAGLARAQEALGRPIAEVFQVIAETTRQPVDSPITRCLREGRMVEMIEPSLLVNRRGQEISMQDSAAPIRDRAGRIVVVIAAARAEMAG